MIYNYDFFCYYFLLINIYNFFLFCYDKWAACNNKWRVSERKLLTITAIGGLGGAILGMLILRHKLKDNTFLPYFGGIIVIWLGFLFYLGLQIL